MVQIANDPTGTVENVCEAPVVSIDLFYALPAVLHFEAVGCTLDRKTAETEVVVEDDVAFGHSLESRRYEGVRRVTGAGRKVGIDARDSSIGQCARDW